MYNGYIFNVGISHIKIALEKKLRHNKMAYCLTLAFLLLSIAQSR